MLCKYQTILYLYHKIKKKLINSGFLTTSIHRTVQVQVPVTVPVQVQVPGTCTVPEAIGHLSSVRLAVFFSPVTTSELNIFFYDRYIFSECLFTTVRHTCKQ